MSMSAIATRAAALLLTSEKGRKGVGFLLVAIFAPVILIAAILCSTTSGGADHNNSAVAASFYGATYSEDVPDEFLSLIHIFPQDNSILGIRPARRLCSAARGRIPQ